MQHQSSNILQQTNLFIVIKLATKHIKNIRDRRTRLSSVKMSSPIGLNPSMV